MNTANKPVFQWMALVVAATIPLSFACQDKKSKDTLDGDALDDPAPVVTAPVLLAEQARRPAEVNDFLRLTFLPSGVEPSGRLGTLTAQYVFAGPTAYYQPALALKDVPAYGGVKNRADRTLLAFRCTPTSQAQLSPILATWPAVFELIRSDFAATYTCPTTAGSAENDLYCTVKDFVDAPVASSSASVYQALALAVAVQQDAGRVNLLKSRYGIYPEFAGLGYSVKLYGNYDPMSAAVVLGNAIVPEYLVKNVALADGECKCIRVSPYEGRDDAPLDPDLILQLGTPDCATVSALEPASTPS